jgi:prevent-host-death family protein
MHRILPDRARPAPPAPRPNTQPFKIQGLVPLAGGQPEVRQGRAMRCALEHVAITDARGELAEVVNHAAYGHERTVLTRRGKPLAAVIPIEDLELLELLEDAADLAEVRAALADPGNSEAVPWEAVKQRLDL